MTQARNLSLFADNVSSSGTVAVAGINATGTPSSTTYLRGDGTWTTVSGGVSSFTAGTTGLTPNTATTGAVTLAGTLATTNGGTGLTSFTSGGVVYASSTSALATGSGITYNGTTFSTTNDASINGLTVGKGAGAVSTNTAVGASALVATASGIRNTGLGYVALTALTSGAENTGLGAFTLTANTTGSYNVAVGSQTLISNTTGASNTALGWNSLANNTTASNNTAVGYQAGYSNQTSGGAVFIGYQAGYGSVGISTTINYNTGIGYQAGYGLTSGYANTLIGNGAGGAITSGYKNTILGGYNGNQGGLDIRTASNYIVLSDGDGNPIKAINGGNTASTEYTQTASSATSVSRMLTAWASATAVNLLTVSNLATNNWTLVKVRILLVHAVGNDSAEIEFVASYGRVSNATPSWTLGTPVITYALSGYSSAGTVTTSGGTLSYTPGFGGQYYKAVFFIDTVSMDSATVTYLL